ncbi:hypothetical protein SAMN05444392_102220 [Seinonella peptonophila]|uniref:Uncharacterized protein n=1 Tax=Seinonella peptonophila TaxID=112248 RepID=A0A1M4V889_9BACL|nr:hypothetical protein [Seinonella peptonophila]SHE65068.1 hypothetical protein SAMN05444392_102220 [Seinonella peptonophila]
MDENTSSWKRADKIALISVIFGIISGVLAVFALIEDINARC